MIEVETNLDRWQSAKQVAFFSVIEDNSLDE